MRAAELLAFLPTFPLLFEAILNIFFKTLQLAKSNAAATQKGQI